MRKLLAGFDPLDHPILFAALGFAGFALFLIGLTAFVAPDIKDVDVQVLQLERSECIVVSSAAGLAVACRDGVL